MTKSESHHDNMALFARLMRGIKRLDAEGAGRSKKLAVRGRVLGIIRVALLARN